MKLTSPNFNDNENIPTKYTCQGESINPQLDIAEAPFETKSLVLIMNDYDAPSGNFVHWTMWNMLPTTTSIEEGKVPIESIQGITSAETNVYVGPCPNSGKHNYVFELSALDCDLDLPANTNESCLRQEMSGHILQHSTLTGSYEKS